MTLKRLEPGVRTIRRAAQPARPPRPSTPEALPVDPPPPAPASRPLESPLVSFNWPACPACGDPGDILSTALPFRYHRCTNPDCSVDKYRSLQLNHNAAAYSAFKARRRSRRE